MISVKQKDGSIEKCYGQIEMWVDGDGTEPMLLVYYDAPCADQVHWRHAMGHTYVGICELAAVDSIVGT